VRPSWLPSLRRRARRARAPPRRAALRGAGGASVSATRRRPHALSVSPALHRGPGSL